jgi:hypothetical protein
MLLHVALIIGKTFARFLTQGRAERDGASVRVDRTGEVPRKGPCQNVSACARSKQCRASLTIGNTLMACLLFATDHAGPPVHGPQHIPLRPGCGQCLYTVGAICRGRGPWGAPASGAPLSHNHGRAACDSRHAVISSRWRSTNLSEKDAELGQKMGQLQPFIVVSPQECMGQLAYFGPT